MKTFRTAAIVFFLLETLLANSTTTIPKALNAYVKQVVVSKAGNAGAVINYRKISRSLYYVAVNWELKTAVSQNELEIEIGPAFSPVFNWAPHLTPTGNHIIPQHVFRAPALIAADHKKMISVIPDLDLIKKNSLPWWMDMDAQANKLVLGLGKSKVTDHVLYEKEEGMIIPPGKTQMGFYIIVSDKSEDIQNPFRRTVAFMWDKWASPLYQSGEPLHQTGMEPYVKQTYEWAFKNWKRAVWQEFELNGKKVGAPHASSF